ncbi:type II CRISPR-associated endonuclease Cas1 [Pelagibius litoralis]|uniref:CRISPR-associated endonuclease Cas1 n=1 Tax=Pelagibius litoralis TaxID=374515 RepID=A0A967C216_9PROT|nr:type II CRISPR-associated endonuclease Cas1 [Pelagibius litoralis]NIA68491.1 type II CRISPR-associated endonuclease Cas1 [Pelagibius litoralis]
MDRIVDIATDGRHLSAYRGFLKVEEGGREVGRIPLDDIAAVVIHAHGITYSNSLLVALAEKNCCLVVCGRNHAPVSVAWPLNGHHRQGARMRAQWLAGKPLQKQLWQRIVVAKIENQAAILEAVGGRSGGVAALAAKVRSGDPENVEAQAARRYWPLLLGVDFRRDRTGGAPNAMLNYGYTVIRAVTARAVVAAGLHPTIGLHHRNRGNDMALADDLMEPFRPFVDVCVKRLVEQGASQVTPEVKQALVSLTAFDVPTKDGVSPLAVCIQRLATAVGQSFEEGKASLEFPLPPKSLDLGSLVTGWQVK